MLQNAECRLRTMDRNLGADIKDQSVKGILSHDYCIIAHSKSTENFNKFHFVESLKGSGAIQS